MATPDVIENAAAAELSALLTDESEDDLERSVAAVIAEEAGGKGRELGG